MKESTVMAVIGNLEKAREILEKTADIIMADVGAIGKEEIADRLSGEFRTTEHRLGQISTDLQNMSVKIDSLPCFKEK